MSDARKVALVGDAARARERGIKLTKYLGAGSYGAAFAATRRGAPCVVKLIVMRSKEDEDEFDREVYMQRIGYKLLPDHVPRPLDAYTVTFGGRRVGVIVMRRVDGILYDLLAARERDVAFMRQVARQLHRMLKRLARARFVHGDMHVCNLGYVMARGGPKLYLLDFGRSYVVDAASAAREVVDIDAFWIWRGSLHDYLPDSFNRALRMTGFPGSSYIWQAVGTDKPAKGKVRAERLEKMAETVVHNVLAKAEGLAKQINVPHIQSIKASSTRI